MDLTINHATVPERLFAREQTQRLSERCGNPGYLSGELAETGALFLNHWTPCVRSWNTPEFKTEFNAVLDRLRFSDEFGHMLENRSKMTVYCKDHPQTVIRNDSRYIFDAELLKARSAAAYCGTHSLACIRDEYRYIFRADTRDYAYLIRCILDGEDETNNHVYIYPYRRDMLDTHLSQAAYGVRFLDAGGTELFRLPDGDTVRIVTKDGGLLDRTVRYVDDEHAEIGGSFYHIQDFARWMDNTGSRLIPLRSSLPQQCYTVMPGSSEVVVVTKCEKHYIRTGQKGRNEADARAIADGKNKTFGHTRAQAKAMLAGFLSGWDAPAADPANYDDE